MKRLFVLTFLLLSVGMNAQQDLQFTQFVQNKMLFNPGFTGNRESICLDVLHRSQWVGVDNAPTTQNFNVNLPVRFLHGGIGLVITNDQIGFFQDITVGLAYGYQREVGNGKLGVGLMVDFKNKALTSGEWLAPDGSSGGTDVSIAANQSTALTPDLSFGVYYENERWWAGLSSSRLIEGEFQLGNQVGSSAAFRGKRHYYLMGGYNWAIPNTNWELMPAVLAKSDLSAPFTVDVNVNALYNKRIWGGVSYRTQDAISAQAGVYVLPALKLGYSYDHTLSDISAQSGGSHEVMLGYCFKIERPEKIPGSYRNPRVL